MSFACAAFWRLPSFSCFCASHERVRGVQQCALNFIDDERRSVIHLFKQSTLEGCERHMFHDIGIGDHMLKLIKRYFSVLV